MRRAQTATEYLVIIILVIILALTVLSILGGIPGLSGSPSSGINDAKLATANVGVVAYSISDAGATVFLRNNLADTISVDAITIDGEVCTPFTPITLVRGQEIEVFCESILEVVDDEYAVSIAIDYTNKKTTAEYSQDDPEYILAAKKAFSTQPFVYNYLEVLYDNDYWNTTSGLGCWDSSVEPKPICTCLDLNRTKTSATTLGWDYNLQNNIDMDRCAENFPSATSLAANWVPIGNVVTAYSGTFDGQGFSVSGITAAGGSYLGLFGDIHVSGTTAGTLQNINVVDANITGVSYLGGLVGNGYYSTIINSSASGNISGTTSNGGLAGMAYYATIINSSAAISLTGTGTLGGLAGDARYGTIADSFATGSLTGTNRLGGLVGYGYDATITNSSSSVSVTGTSNDIGGLVGYGSVASITDSSASGSVTGTNQIGGLVGIGVNIHILNSFASGNVNGTSWSVGGLVGDGDTANISNSYATGSVTGSSSNTGGLVGDGDDATISSSFATGSVTGYAFTGGLIGKGLYTIVSDSYATGDVTSSSFNTGGFIGYIGNGNVANSYATGDVTSTNRQVGGLIGGSRYSTVLNSSATGSVNGTYDIGGLAGYSRYNTVSNSYATGNVTGTGRGIGGLVGYDLSISLDGTINQSYTTSSVHCAPGGSCASIGGLLGLASTSTAINGTNTWFNYTDDDAISCWGSGTPTVNGACTTS